MEPAESAEETWKRSPDIIGPNIEPVEENEKPANHEEIPPDGPWKRSPEIVPRTR
jgi:hypothetical protein